MDTVDPGPAGPRPFGVPSAGFCEFVITGPRASWQCGLPAAWAMPEYPVCHAHRSHLPPELEAVRRERIRRWHDESTALWKRITEEVPAP